MITLELNHKLRDAGINYIEDLLALSRADFLALPGLSEEDFLALAHCVAMHRDQLYARAREAWLLKNAPEIKLGNL